MQIPSVDADGTEYLNVYGFAYPVGYGTECDSWDDNLPPECADEFGAPIDGRPDTCTQNWCYVSPECATGIPSYIFFGSPLVYSFDACLPGGPNSGALDDHLHDLFEDHIHEHQHEHSHPHSHGDGDHEHTHDDQDHVHDDEQLDESVEEPVDIVFDAR